MADEEIQLNAAESPTATNASETATGVDTPLQANSGTEPLQDAWSRLGTEQPVIVDNAQINESFTATPDSLSGSAVAEVARMVAAIYDEVHKAVVGQEEVLESAVAGLLANGHILLEGVPGTAKTLLVRSIAASIGKSTAASSLRLT